MSIDQNRLLELFSDLVELPPASRRTLLEARCPDDDPLRGELESLLHAHESAGGFLNDGSLQHPAEVDFTLPQQLGPYRLGSLIGEGGFANVFEAQQTEPVRRKVALKLLKLGMDTSQIVRRFEAERQTLASMMHPNIAAVYDAGVTPQGRPFFVMELVKGMPITSWCDAHRLDARGRASLLLPVCAAVAHAHRRGVIHRDLKPSNVLVCDVDSRAVPKVIDFGIAKALDAETNDLAVTEAGQRVGTFAYMSPEQCDSLGADLDTRVDVYGLGAILYELLCGQPPLNLERTGGGSNGGRNNSWREPQPPSRRIGKGVHTIPRELEWIAMRCLERDRDRRYSGADDLADDLRRFCEGRAVRAAPPAWSYRARKFIRRHAVPLSLAALAAASLIGGLVASLLLLRSARQERNRAESSLAETQMARDSEEEVNRFLNGLLGVAAPLGSQFTGGADLRVRQVLDASALALDANGAQRFAARPLSEARLRLTIGQAYESLDEPDRAVHHLKQALQLYEAHAGPIAPDTLDAAYTLAVTEVKSSATRLDAVRMAQSWHARAVAAYGEDDRRVLALKNALGLGLYFSGDLEQAKMTLAPALDRAQAAAARAALDQRFAWADLVQDLFFSLAGTIQAQGDQEGALQLFEKARDLANATWGPHSLRAKIALQNIGSALSNLGRHAEALELYQDAWEGHKTHYGENHPDTRALEFYVGHELSQINPAAAVSLLRSARKFSMDYYGVDSVQTADREAVLALALERTKADDESLALREHVLSVRRAKLGESAQETLRMSLSVAATCERLGLFERGLDAAALTYSHRASIPDQSPRAARLYGMLLAGCGRFQDAEPVLLEAHRLTQNAPSNERGPKAYRRFLQAIISTLQATHHLEQLPRFELELSTLRSETEPSTTPASRPS